MLKKTVKSSSIEIISCYSGRVETANNREHEKNRRRKKKRWTNKKLINQAVLRLIRQTDRETDGQSNKQMIEFQTSKSLN
jgi:hypothetical protein